MKNIISSLIVLLLLIPATNLHAQGRDISCMTSGGKLHLLQAIVDIRHHTLALDVNIQQETITGYTSIDFYLRTNNLLEIILLQSGIDEYS